MSRSLIRWMVPLAVLGCLWGIPTPEGLSAQAWHIFAIFVATIVGILSSPISSGALIGSLLPLPH